MVVLILHLFCLLQVIDINEPPTDINLSNNTIVENSKIGTIIGHLTVSDPDHNQTHSCALIRNPFQTFEITSTLSSGNRDQFFLLTVMQNLYLNYEFVKDMDIVIQCNDSGIPIQSFKKQFNINVTDINERPHHLYISNYRVGENYAAGKLVGTFQTRDLDIWDNHFHYKLLRGTNYFRLVKNRLFTKITFDYEKRDSYEIEIRSSDSAGKNLFKLNI